MKREDDVKLHRKNSNMKIKTETGGYLYKPQNAKCCHQPPEGRKVSWNSMILNA
jgi:hypothetical protein